MSGSRGVREARSPGGGGDAGGASGMPGLCRRAGRCIALRCVARPGPLREELQRWALPPVPQVGVSLLFDQASGFAEK